MRKVLSFVLVLTLVLSSFSMAFAATPAATAAGLSDIAGNTNEAAIQVAYDLGIVTGNPDGTYLPAKAVTRAEFAAMITRALAIPDSALAGYTATSFKDTTGYGWAVPYLAFCQSKGILLGDGAGNVMPGRTINMNEAVTMVLRAIGYTSNSSTLVGVWPANYVSLAQDLSLYDKVASVANVDKANAAQILYNALAVTKVQVATDGTTTNLATSMLTSGLDCSKTDRIVNQGDSSVINLTPYIGAYATVFTNSDGDVVAVKEKSDFLTGKFNSDYSKFKVDGVDYTMASSQTVTTTTALINDAANATSNGAIDSGKFATDKTYTIAADLSGKTINGVYTVNEWRVTDSAKADSGVQDEIGDKKLLNYDFAQNDDEQIDNNSFTLVGVSSLDKIAKDNVIYVYTLGNGNNADIVKVAVGTETVEGVVQAYNGTDDAAKIAGKYYDNSGNGTDIGNNEVSDTVKAYLDGYGKIYDFDKTAGSADEYALVTGGTTTSGYDTIVKLITADGTNKTYTVDTDNVTYSAIKGQLAGYSVNSDGQVDALNAGNDANTGNALVKGSSNLVTANALQVVNARTARVTGAALETAVISSDVLVYTYDDAATPGGVGATYDVSSIDKVSDDVVTSQSALYLDKDGVIVAMVVPASAATASDTDLYGVVSDKIKTVNDANDAVYELTGFANGASLDKLTTSLGTASVVANTDTNITLYKMKVDADGNINNVTTVSEAVGAGANVSGGGTVVADAGTGYIQLTGGAVMAIADNAKFYQVTKADDGTIDAYSVYNGSVRAGYHVWLYETDSDYAGYDVVVVEK